MNVLVTGAKGFIGKYISNYFSNDYNILQPCKQELDLLNLSQVTTYFENNQIDIVIHCALIGREEVYTFNPKLLSDNFIMFHNLWLNKDKFNSLINMGTCMEYDQDKNNFNVEEHETVNVLPKKSYALCKNLIGRIINNTENFFNLRLFYVFHETEIEKRFLKKVIHLDEVIIHNDQYADYIYLEDIMPIIKTIISNQCSDKVINMVYPEKYRLSEIAYMLCDVLNINKTKIKILGSNGINMIGNSQKLLNYKFELVGLKKGLEKYKSCN